MPFGTPSSARLTLSRARPHPLASTTAAMHRLITGSTHCHAFWSLTMYALPSQLLVKNPINRYLINAPMLPGLKRDADGGLTIYIQNESPGGDKESNWLPAPKGPFMMAARYYWPKPELLDDKWKSPAVQPAK